MLGKAMFVRQNYFFNLFLKVENYYLCGFVFAAVIDHNDFIGKSWNLFLQEDNF